MKFCKDCEHHIPPGRFSTADCVRPTKVINMIDGELEWSTESCKEERHSLKKNRCGPRARFFKQRITAKMKLAAFLGQSAPTGGI